MTMTCIIDTLCKKGEEEEEEEYPANGDEGQEAASCMLCDDKFRIIMCPIH